MTNRREVEPKPELSVDEALPTPKPLLDDSLDDTPPEPPIIIPTEPGPVEDMPEETPAVEEPAIDFDALFDSEPEARAPTTEEPPLTEEPPSAKEPEMSEPAKSESTESAPVDMPLAEETDDVLEDLFGSEDESTEKEMPADEQPEPQPAELPGEQPSAKERAEDAPSVDAEEDLFGELSDDAPADEPSSDVDLGDLFGSEDVPAEEVTEDGPAEEIEDDEEADLFADPDDQPEPDAADEADDELPVEEAPVTETPPEEESAEESAEEPAEESSEDDDLFGDGLALTIREGGIMNGGLSSRSYRTWVDNTGRHTTRGRLVKIVRGKVQILKETGRTTSVPLHRLSRADLAFVSAQFLAAQRENLAAQTAQK